MTVLYSAHVVAATGITASERRAGGGVQLNSIGGCSGVRGGGAGEL